MINTSSTTDVVVVTSSVGKISAVGAGDGADEGKATLQTPHVKGQFFITVG